MRQAAFEGTADYCGAGSFFPGNEPANVFRLAGCGVGNQGVGQIAAAQDCGMKIAVLERPQIEHGLLLEEMEQQILQIVQGQ